MSHWSFAISFPVMLIGAAVWIATAWLCWTNWTRNGRRPRIALLEGLRLLIATLLVFTLFRPEFVKKIERNELPEVAVLSDASGSMLTRDIVSTNGIIARATWLEHQESRTFWNPLTTGAEVVRIRFSPAPNLTNDVTDDAVIGTDLHTALDSVLQRQKQLKAVLLLSDGDWNLGPSPVGVSTRYRDRSIPIFSVKVGQDKAVPDLAIEEVNAPAYGLFGEQISIPFTLQSHLARDVQTTISLLNEGQEVVSRKIIIPANGRLRDAITWYPRKVGESNLTLTIPVEQDEGLPDNNQRDLRIAVRVVKLNILVVDTLPRWEYRFLRNALARDPGVNMNCVLLHPDMNAGGGRHYLSDFPGSREMLSRYDVIFLGDVGIGQHELSMEDANLIRGLVEQQASGLVFIPGRRGRQLTLLESPLKELMPVVLDPAKAKGNGLQNEASLILSNRGRGHLLTRFDADEFLNDQIWKMLPGFYWSAGVVKNRPGSEVLAVHSELRNQWGRIPLLAIRDAGHGKVLFLGTDSAWRWRRGVEDKFHYRFWSQVARWMSHQRHLAEKEGIRLSFTPEVPKAGETVFLQATVLDATGFPLEKGEISGIVTAASGKTDRLAFSAVDGGWGVFKAEFMPRVGGAHKISISAPEHGRDLETELVVELPNLEKHGRPANIQALKEIATITHGKSVSPEELDDLIQQISLLPEPKAAEFRILLWSDPWWGGLILLLLTTYWTGRKLTGFV